MILFTVFIIIFIHTCCIWLWYRFTDNPSVIDVGWASGLTLSALVYMSQQPFSLRTLLLCLVILIWGVRLGGYLWWTRIRKKQIDKRYTALSDTWKIKKRIGFFLNFQLQGLFIFIVSLSWYFTSLNAAKNISVLDCLAFFLFISAISLESLADYQLQSFKKESPGAVCNRGLWRLSRHPNLFFEWLIWCAFSLFALSSPHGLLGFISPITLYCIMTLITIPITERESVKSRGEKYITYQHKVPVFFPAFPRDNESNFHIKK